MTVLPSPIPHPLDLAPWELPDWAYQAIGWVVGVEWPEGDERAVFDLADGWSTAASALSAPCAEARSAAAEVLRGYGGPGADAFAAAWRTLSDGADAPLVALAAVADELAAVARECAAGIEAAKLEVWIEVGLLVIELVGLAVAIALTAGAATPAATAAATVTRMSIQQIFRRLVGQLSREALRRRVRSLAPAARRAGLDGLVGAAEGVAVDAAIQGYQVAVGHRPVGDLRSVGMSALDGFVAGALPVPSPADAAGRARRPVEPRLEALEPGAGGPRPSPVDSS